MSVVIAFVALAVSFVTLYINYVRLKIENFPLLSVEIENDSKLSYDNGKFFIDNNEVEEIWFSVLNNGKGTAIVRKIYRRWGIYEDGAYPSAIESVDLQEGQTHKESGLYVKNCDIAIGGGGRSQAIRACLENLHIVDIPNNGAIIFDLKFEFLTIDGRADEAAPILIFRNGRFHTALTYLQRNQASKQFGKVRAHCWAPMRLWQLLRLDW
ncbi:hypothetical protein [Amaricoccus sp. W119]|uniref:hypothetical protein n=1 Tax=Amaricoccus sp. W119 TaxID=3391833 RepID=UPI0039A6DD43